jgi:hypothetical protein
MKLKTEINVISLIRDFEEMRDKIGTDKDNFEGATGEAMRVASIMTLNNVIDHLKKRANFPVQDRK